MRIVAVARVMNEDDVVEAFVRHTLALADAMVLLDNGSTDRTLDILAALRAEGAALTVLQSRAPFTFEVQYNTLLYHTADQAFRPDWVLHLDADEFIDGRQADLRQRLEAVPPEVQAVLLPLRNYYAEGAGGGDLLVPRRMTLRDAADRGVTKCMLRGGLPSLATVGGGNHAAWVGGEPAASMPVAELPLAHYPDRHPLQFILKAALGRIKAIAGGGGPDVVAAVNAHYAPVLDALLHNPASLLRDPARMGAALPALPLVEDPIRYAGGELRHTVPCDPAMKAVRALASAAELLAASHGALLDADPAAWARLQDAAMRAELIR